MGFNEVILKVIELMAKFPIKRIAVITLIFTASLLFLPLKITDFFGITVFVMDNKQWISFAFLLSFVCVFIIFGYKLFLFLITIKNTHKKAKKERLNKESIDKKLNNLDDSEKAVLREFFLQKSATITVPINEEPVANLLNSHVLKKSNNYSHYLEYSIIGLLCDLEIDNYAMIKLDYKALGLPNSSNSFLDNDKHNLLNKRPTYISNILMHKHL